MALTPEMAPNIYRIWIFAEWANLQFNHFLVRGDDEPLLFPAGLPGDARGSARSNLETPNVFDLRHISFSHFESDGVWFAQRVVSPRPQNRLLA